MKSLFQKIIFSGLLMLFSLENFAQCAMCRATAESATESVDKGIGEGLNSGILYLMGVPYLLLLTVGVIFFRKKIVAIFKS
jgi:hypothetical protein